MWYFSTGRSWICWHVCVSSLTDSTYFVSWIDWFVGFEAFLHPLIEINLSSISTSIKENLFINVHPCNLPVVFPLQMFFILICHLYQCKASFLWWWSVISFFQFLAIYFYGELVWAFVKELDKEGDPCTAGTPYWAHIRHTPPPNTFFHKSFIKQERKIKMTAFWLLQKRAANDLVGGILQKRKRRTLC